MFPALARYCHPRIESEKQPRRPGRFHRILSAIRKALSKQLISDRYAIGLTIR
jgi:hypothetical protein